MNIAKKELGNRSFAISDDRGGGSTKFPENAHLSKDRSRFFQCCHLYACSFDFLLIYINNLY